MSNNNNNDSGHKNNNNNQSVVGSEKQLRHQIEQRHLELYRQNSLNGKTNRIVRNDLESKINRM